MVDLNIVLDSKPVTTPDAEFRIKSAWRLLAEMVYSMVEGAERDSEQVPAGNPLQIDAVPSQAQDTPTLEV